MEFERSCVSRLVGNVEQLKSLEMDDPIELLMLAAGQEGMTVRFEDIIMEESMGTFMCSVEVDQLFKRHNVIGFGSTKKDARRNSAQEAILELTHRLNDLSQSSPTDVQSNSPTNDDNIDDVLELPTPPLPKPSSRLHTRECTSSTNQGLRSRWADNFVNIMSTPALSGLRSSKLSSTCTSDNPIGELKELADTYNWEQPVYNEVDEYGQDHKKTFVINCLFRNMKTEGIAPKKRAAKKEAAKLMLAMMHDKDGRSGRTPSPRHVPSVSKMCTNDATQTDFYLEKLKLVENKLKVRHTFHDLSGAGYHGNCLCFIRIDTDPVTVCHGSGITQQLAHNSAARNALKILQNSK